MMLKEVPKPSSDEPETSVADYRVPHIMWRSLAELEHEVRHWSTVEHGKRWIEMHGSIDGHRPAVQLLKRDLQRVRLAIEYLARTP